MILKLIHRCRKCKDDSDMNENSGLMLIKQSYFLGGRLPITFYIIKMKNLYVPKIEK